MVYDVLGEVARAQQALEPIAVLPQELLVAIFTNLSVSERITAALVCKAWRDIVLETHELWTNVDFNKSGPPGALAAHIRLSGTAVPLEALDVCVNQGNIEEVCTALEGNIGRARKLGVTIDESPEEDELKRRLTFALVRPAPLLRLFRLFDHAGTWNCDLDPDAVLFSGVAPRLRVVKMHCSTSAIAGSAGVLAGVTHALYSPARSFYPRLVQEVLKLLPAVQELAVEVDGWSETEIDDKVKFPSTVNEFVIIVNRNEFEPAALLKYLDHESVPRVWASYNRECFTTNVDASLDEMLQAIGPVRTLRIDTSTYDDTTFNLQCYAGDVQLYKPAPFDVRAVERVMLDISMETGLPGLPNLLRHVRTLYVGEPSFFMDVLRDRADLGGGMPHLETLVLVVLKPDNLAQHGHSTVFLPHESEDSRYPVRCPNLKKLRIAARTEALNAEAGGILLDPALVLLFLDQYISFNAPKLEELILHGTRLIENNFDDVARLLARVESVSTVDGHLQWNREYSDLLHWQGFFCETPVVQV